MHLSRHRPPLARRAVSGALVLAVHAVAVAGFLQVRVHRPEPVEAPAIEVALVDGPRTDAPAPERTKVQLDEVKVVIPDVPQFDLPAVTQPAPTAITVAALSEGAPPAATPRAASDAPVLVESVDYLKAPPPVYPPKARRTHAEGTVLLLVLIDTQGHARDVQIHRSSGHEELDKAARDAVLTSWAFRPYINNGVPRSVVVIVPIQFGLVRTASR